MGGSGISDKSLIPRITQTSVRRRINARRCWGIWTGRTKLWPWLKFTNVNGIGLTRNCPKISRWTQTVIYQIASTCRLRMHRTQNARWWPNHRFLCITAHHREMGTSISEASKKVPIFLGLFWSPIVTISPKRPVRKPEISRSFLLTGILFRDDAL